MRNNETDSDKEISNITLKTAMRQRAEHLVRENESRLPELQASATQADIIQILHELRVHQIELEIQNEELVRAQAELENLRIRYFNLYDLAPVGYMSITKDGIISESNLAGAEMLGMSRSEITQQIISKFILKKDRDIYYLNRKELLRTGASQSFELRLMKKGGKTFWAYLTIAASMDRRGTPVYRLVISDITLRKSAEESLRGSEERFRSLLQNVQGISVQGYGPDGTIQYWNSASEDLYGYSEAEAIGRNLIELIVPAEARKSVRDGIRKMLLTGEPLPSSETTFMRKDGSPITVLSSYGIVQVPGQNPELFCFDIDLSIRKKAENELRISEEKYRLITENVSDVISIYNLALRRFTYVSPSIFSLRGITPEEAVNESLEDALTAESFVILRDAMEKNLLEFEMDQDAYSNTYRVEIQQLRKNGEPVWVEVSIKLRYNSDEDIELVCVSRNIQERKKAEKEITRLSYHDHLTGLYNRRFYEEELSRLDTQRNLPVTLVMADVNGLKLINDSFGHATGDDLLRKVAEVITRGCRADDIVARLGGDEFVIILPRTDSIEAREIIRRIERLAETEKTGGLDISVSFGFETKNLIEENIYEIFKSAEDRMYRCKIEQGSGMRSRTIAQIMKALYEKSVKERLHSIRVSELCEAIAIEMKFDRDEVRRIKTAGLMHDIGKIALADNILNTPDKLSNEEWKEVQRHSEIGYRILSSANEFTDMAGYVFEHQERWDGKGYPKGLKGEEISLEARIIAVVEAYDAMTNQNTDGGALSEEEAIQEIKKCSGTQFDPDIADEFCAWRGRQLKS